MPVTPDCSDANRKPVRHTPSSMFYVQTPTPITRTTTKTTASVAKSGDKVDQHVTPRSRARKGGGNQVQCSNLSGSCPEIPATVKKTPTMTQPEQRVFTSSLRNYAESPQMARKKKRQNSPELKSECARFVVAVRMRPFNTVELEEPNVAPAHIDFDTKENAVRVRNVNCEVFHFDYIFNGINDQENVYNSIGRQVLQSALDGYNACLFAYGQTGSGKTYSIVGNEDSPGVIPRFGKELFDHIAKNDDVVVELSYYEIYNEKIHDLLSSDKKPLKVRENPNIGPYVVNLSLFTLDSNEDFQALISLGNTRRITGANGTNEYSSRAHAICAINVIQNNLGTNGSMLTSRINIVDLAGSERASAVNSTGDRLKEGVAINKSLLTLGKVFNHLVERSAHIPYRESVLTWLLKDSLGSNSRTFMLATISPSAVHMDETVTTLRYACHSRKIVNEVKVNVDPKAEKIRQLLLEVDRLKMQQKELDELNKERTKLGEKLQLIKEYEIELEQLRGMLDEAKLELQRKSSVQSKQTKDNMGTDSSVIPLSQRHSKQFHGFVSDSEDVLSSETQSEHPKECDQGSNVIMSSGHNAKHSKEKLQRSNGSCEILSNKVQSKDLDDYETDTDEVQSTSKHRKDCVQKESNKTFAAAMNCNCIRENRQNTYEVQSSQSPSKHQKSCVQSLNRSFVEATHCNCNRQGTYEVQSTQSPSKHRKDSNKSCINSEEVMTCNKCSRQNTYEILSSDAHSNAITVDVRESNRRMSSGFEAKQSTKVHQVQKSREVQSNYAKDDADEWNCDLFRTEGAKHSTLNRHDSYEKLPPTETQSKHRRRSSLHESFGGAFSNEYGVQSHYNDYISDGYRVLTSEVQINNCKDYIQGSNEILSSDVLESKQIKGGDKMADLYEALPPEVQSKLLKEKVESSYGILIFGKDCIQLVPNVQVETIVNNKHVNVPTNLSDGDHLFLGGRHRFRISLLRRNNLRDPSVTSNMTPMPSPIQAPTPDSAFVTESSSIATPISRRKVNLKSEKSDFLDQITKMFSHLYDESVGH